MMMRIRSVGFRWPNPGGSLALLLTISACSSSDEGPELMEAYGTVTVDGVPESYLKVSFISPEGITHGLTDANGEYTIRFNDTRSGTFPGANRVSIERVSPSEYEDVGDLEEDEDEFEERIESEMSGQRLPARFNDDTELTVEVTAEGAPYDFELITE